jgi:hypothetical protein
MRLLAISDIHNNLVAVRRLRALERNDFDAIIVAGDLGNAAASQIFEILASFKCPVLYVYGNWDHALDYVSAPFPDFQLIHQDVVTVSGYHFSGFSGCPTQWGKNPIARKLADAPDARERTLRLNRDGLRKVLKRSGADPRKTIVVTHERLGRLAEIAPHALLHLFGHVHGFADTAIQDTLRQRLGPRSPGLCATARQASLQRSGLPQFQRRKLCEDRDSRRQTDGAKHRPAARLPTLGTAHRCALRRPCVDR